MQSNLKQLSLTDIYTDLDEYFHKDKPKLLKLFDQYIDLSELIPQSFINHYYVSTGHPRNYKLSSMITAFIIKMMLSIADISLLINVLNLSSELKTLCGFSRVPNASQFSRLKIDFEDDFLMFFNNLVETTEPICRRLRPDLADILVVDTTGIEGYVKENNPKAFDTVMRNTRKFSKNIPNFNVQSYACSQMPKEALSNKSIKLSYINGHYCYSRKVALVTNSLGIIRHIYFYNSDYSINIADAKSGAEHKDNYDAKSPIPVLNNFFNYHPDFKYKYFLADAGFDAIDNYKYLYKDYSMIPIIPLNPRRTKDIDKIKLNENGIPTCPNNKSLQMKFDGSSKEKGRPLRLKWRCPKSKKTAVKGKTTYILSCENSCTTSPCGRMHHTTVNDNYRLNTIIPRGSDKWIRLYKIRTIIERTNFMVRFPMYPGYTKLRNTVSLKVEVILAAITQQIVILIADKLDKQTHLLSVKSLIA
ncbi:DDE transposase [Clostridium sp.]|uniref:DDE transposase n=1 Tax=Clostridium sp. TaxID=1506 RepID=UPI002611E88E|nr:DDE transposase [uncultured Clostridium sp.]